MTRALLLVVLAFACAPAAPKLGSGKARLADADGVAPLPEGPVVEVLPGAPPPATVPSGDVRIAADTDATWGEVTAVVDAVRKGGGRPYLAVVKRREVMALAAPDPRDATGLRLVATDAKACLSFPDVAEAMCVSRFDRKHIDRAHTREAVRKAVKQYGFTQVNVAVDPALSWGDAVRAIDSARTCCGAQPMRVSVESF